MVSAAFHLFLDNAPHCRRITAAQQSSLHCFVYVILSCAGGQPGSDQREDLFWSYQEWKGLFFDHMVGMIA